MELAAQERWIEERAQEEWLLVSLCLSRCDCDDEFLFSDRHYRDSMSIVERERERTNRSPTCSFSFASRKKETSSSINLQFVQSLEMIISHVCCDQHLSFSSSSSSNASKFIWLIDGSASCSFRGVCAWFVSFEEDNQLPLLFPPRIHPADERCMKPCWRTTFSPNR